MKQLTLNYVIKFFTFALVAFSFAAFAKDTNTSQYYELVQIKFTKAPTKLEKGELEIFISEEEGKPCKSSLCALRLNYSKETVFRIRDTITRFSSEELLSMPLKSADVVVEQNTDTVLSVNFNDPI